MFMCKPCDDMHDQMLADTRVVSQLHLEMQGLGSQKSMKRV